MARDLVYFDLETQRTAADVGGWDRKRDMGMSVGVTYSTRTGEYRIFPESKAQELIDQLLKAELVIGYNVINFDFEVLMGYTILDLPYQIRALDMMVDVERLCGHRLKLDALAQGTLGLGKTGVGTDAIKWWREGRIMDIAQYCCFDVKVTRLVHEYGCRTKELFYFDRAERRQRLQVEWDVELAAA